MNDIIERLMELSELLKWQLHPSFHKTVDEAIAALSPVLPEDVAEMRDFLLQSATQRAVDNLPASAEAHKQAADMLERLARENSAAESFKRLMNMSGQNAHLRLMNAEQRIAELEADNKQIESLRDRLQNGIKYDEKLNIYTVRWTARELESVQKAAEEIYKKIHWDTPEQPK